MNILIKILEVLLASPVVGQIIERLMAALFLWLNRRYDDDTKKMISEAEVAQVNAKTREERLQAGKLWRDALSRRRVDT